MDFNVEVGSHEGWTLLKVPIILKNALDKSSLKLNVSQKKKKKETVDAYLYLLK